MNTLHFYAMRNSHISQPSLDISKRENHLVVARLGSRPIAARLHRPLPPPCVSAPTCPVRAMIGCPSSNSVGLTTRLTIGAKRAGSRNFQKLQKNCSQMTLSSLLFPFSSRILQRHILSFRIPTFLLLAFFKVYLVHVEGHQE
jgi:hypothetical protein